jgi:endonuclease/exonuclease/phosphatase family metal-dependent hydrolase
MPDTFSLLTLNCFGGYLPDTGRRLLALAQELERRADQVVCLQEIQLNRYLRLLLRACCSFSYHAYEPYVQCPKGGLLTLARMPIRSRQFIPYTQRGLWYTPMIMDRLLYKGMLITMLEWANMPVVVINTHVLANYMGDWQRRGVYARIEEQQLQQLAETVRSQPTEALVVVMGDFNVPRGSSLYDDFLIRSGLDDPLAGDTRPTHRPPPGVPARYALPLDHVLLRMPADHGLKIDCDLCFADRQWQRGKRQDYFSDHNAISIRITSRA